MNTIKLFSFLNKNSGIIFVRNASQISAVEHSADKKLEHYRNLNALDQSQVRPKDWNEAKPFERIPGPQPYPLVGNAWRFFLPFGDFYGLDFIKIHENLYYQYGDVTILKGLLGRPPLVMLFNPDDIEKMHKNEGVWPHRDGLQSFTYYRTMRKNILPSGGLVTLQGEEWFKFRSIVNPILMQPRNVVHYTDKMNLVADEFVENIRYFSKLNDQGQMPDDFQKEIYKWSLESIGVVTLDTHLGCLKRESNNADNQKLIQSVLNMFQLMYKLDVLPSMWKWFSTRNWREYVRTLDFLLNTNLKHINKQLDKIENGEINVNDEASSALQKMIKIDRTVALAMAVDMMIAGVDTTGRVLGAALYFLAKNPKVQEKFREEAFSLLKTKDSPVTKETLSKASYVRAVIKETTRLSPIAIGNARTTNRDLVLGGYQIPAGTDLLTSTLFLSRQDQHFPRAKEFLPERWLTTTTGDLSHKKVNPFVYAPFGYGPRSCIGKRLANLELETALLKIIRNFEFDWPYDDIKFSITTLHGIAEPLKLHVKAVEC